MKRALKHCQTAMETEHTVGVGGRTVFGGWGGLGAEGCQHPTSQPNKHRKAKKH